MIDLEKAKTPKDLLRLMIEKKLVTPKQAKSLMDSLTDNNWFMNLSHGGVRAGKTFINNFLFLFELVRAKKMAEKDGVRNPMYILAASSSGTLQTNILQEMTNIFGIEFQFDKHNNFTLFGVKVITTFTSSISGLRAIRGMTSYGAYINEMSLANEEVFSEITKRLSGRGARLIGDTNPDHPEHWLYKDYIQKADGKRIVATHWTIDDNAFLTPEYIANIKATVPSGTMYDRAILGLWTIGEGAVYKDFNQSTMVVPPDELPEMKYHIVGVDWGYKHYGAMVVIGIDHDDTYYIVEEHAHQHLHIDEWIEIAQGIAEDYGRRIVFWCDSARPEYVEALYMANLTAENAKKSVLPGITEVGRAMKSDKFFVVNTATKLLNEVNQYVWSKTSDRPLEKNDDVLDAVRYAIYSDKENSKPLFS